MEQGHVTPFVLYTLKSLFDKPYAPNSKSECWFLLCYLAPRKAAVKMERPEKSEGDGKEKSGECIKEEATVSRTTEDVKDKKG